MPEAQNNDIASITQHLDNIKAMVQDMHTKKQNMTRPALQNIENEISKAKNSIIHHLLPISCKQANKKPDAQQQTPRSQPSYSDMVRKRSALSTIIIETPSQTSDTSDPTTAQEVINRVTEHIAQKNHHATIQETTTTNNKEKVIIKFNKTDNVQEIAGELRSQLGLNARSRKPLLPKMTISHIPSHIDPKNDLREHILKNNSFLTEPMKDGQLEILFTYKTRDFSSAIIKITPNVRSIIKSNHTITIGNRACPVRDRVQPQRCSHCCGFGHSRKHCRSTSPTCAFCASDHTS